MDQKLNKEAFDFAAAGKKLVDQIRPYYTQIIREERMELDDLLCRAKSLNGALCGLEIQGKREKVLIELEKEIHKLIELEESKLNRKLTEKLKKLQEVEFEAEVPQAPKKDVTRKKPNMVTAAPQKRNAIKVDTSKKEVAEEEEELKEQLGQLRKASHNILLYVWLAPKEIRFEVSHLLYQAKALHDLGITNDKWARLTRRKAMNNLSVEVEKIVATRVNKAYIIATDENVISKAEDQIIMGLKLDDNFLRQRKQQTTRIEKLRRRLLKKQEKNDKKEATGNVTATPDENPAQAPLPKTSEELAALAAERDEFRKKLAELEAKITKCCICLERQPTMLFMPCSHVCVCDGCFTPKSITGCPVCRKTIRKASKIYL